MPTQSTKERVLQADPTLHLLQKGVAPPAQRKERFKHKA